MHRTRAMAKRPPGVVHATARETFVTSGPRMKLRFCGGTDLCGRPATPRALYYVRVPEIPTPRWTTYDAVRNQLSLLEDVPITVQERAWSSPPWNTPQAGG